MKKVLFLFTLLSVSMTVSAQHETLFSRARIIGGFGGPLLEFSNIKGDHTTSMGGGGGLIIDNFFIGAYGVGSLDHLQYNINNGDDFRMDLAHGGLWMGYTPYTFKLVHPYISTKIGWGFADIRNDPFKINSDGDAIFVFTPEVGMELNLTRFFRMGASLGYRMVSDVDRLDNYTNKDFSSLTGQITFRFGWFGRNYRSSDVPSDLN
ncbi:MAG: outer membrane beta-barrel protein [Saprospiraceae bacterium]|nr:outer membrane beta-barrel protein [Saprospiraceae bacterium]